MAKAVEIDGKTYRVRRGKLVEIPAEWVGKIVHSRTKRARKSNKEISRRTRKSK